MLSFVEENYLKAIYHLSKGGKNAVSTNSLAETMNNKAASVTDMIKKLSAKEVISYEKYKGVNISQKGKTEALSVIRKHRLWETFLVEKLGFSWDEVHEVAEQLEHIKSPLLIEKLDAFLDHPSVDPHGHPIPDKHGKINEIKQIPLTACSLNKKYTVQSVKDGSPAFLQYLDKLGIYIKATLVINDRIDFDNSLELIIDDKTKAFISQVAAENLLVTE